ncbi:MAG: F0F1 ATP synthase subunit A [Planctomycetes bacterium]|nr:F0F1 ATP synthase subunit A [Planctomycetota bacterium]
MMDQLLTLAAGSPADHVYNHVAIKSADGYWLWSGNQGNLVLSAIILILGGLYVGSRVKTGPESEGNDRFITRGKFAQMVEVICVYLRDEVTRPLLGDRTDRLMPILWTLFFFILINNLLGLLPLLDIQHLLFPNLRDSHAAYIGGTATQNIWVTGALALIAAVLFNGAAIVRLGPVGFISHMMGGLPWYMFPIAFLLLVIEAAGQFVIKPVALAVRLFANMTAGHILLATLFMFVGVVWDKGILIQGPVTLISILGGIAVMILELFVAFLQAFVFMFLTAVFISLMDHHEEHGHEHGHDHAHGHEHAHA